jgi:hypothetical protein
MPIKILIVTSKVTLANKLYGDLYKFGFIEYN